MCIHLNLMIFTKIIRGFISIKREFDANGISFPYPQMDVHVVRLPEKAE
ncbi:mechanosensitive channel MscS [Klebsiella pneumoniae]|nr:mechanosensitive channel MscS [Klebsiella pneumoniae]